MKEMNKIWDYKGQQLNTSVKMIDVEKRVDGTKTFKVVCNSMGVSNFYNKTNCIEKHLRQAIILIEQTAKDHIDGKLPNKSKIEQELIDLGFS